MLIAAVQRANGSHRALNVTFNNCDYTKEENNVFNPANPSGTWDINLKEPYGMMVIEECFFLANNKAGCDIVKLQYWPDHVDPETSKGEYVTLVRHLQPGIKP